MHSLYILLLVYNFFSFQLKWGWCPSFSIAYPLYYYPSPCETSFHILFLIVRYTPANWIKFFLWKSIFFQEGGYFRVWNCYKFIKDENMIGLSFVYWIKVDYVKFQWFWHESFLNFWWGRLFSCCKFCLKLNVGSFGCSIHLAYWDELLLDLNSAKRLLPRVIVKYWFQMLW